jgi:hypothetical protein
VSGGGDGKGTRLVAGLSADLLQPKVESVGAVMVEVRAYLGKEATPFVDLPREFTDGALSDVARTRF